MLIILSYQICIDLLIGFKRNEITSDICVVIMIENKDINAMYPVSPSDEFDKEGLSTSKEFKLKRLQGGIKR